MVKSALIAGLSAGFIWVVITTLVDKSDNTVVLGGFGFLIVTAVVTFLISTMVVRSKTS